MVRGFINWIVDVASQGIDPVTSLLALGDASAYGGVEVRTHLFHSRYLLPVKFGGLVFLDVGRVFLEGEDSNKWHTGYGGGLWIAPDVAEYGQLTDMRFIMSYGRSTGEDVFYFSTQYAF